GGQGGSSVHDPLQPFGNDIRLAASRGVPRHGPRRENLAALRPRLAPGERICVRRLRYRMNAHEHDLTRFPQISRRQMLARCGTGFGMMALASLLDDTGRSSLRASTTDSTTLPLSLRPPHFRPRAKRVVHIFMNGGPSQVDTFDPKPALD